MTAYGAPARHYHDAEHVGGIWSTWLRLGGDPNDNAILWSAAYHDIVYEIGQPKGWNEEQSARRLISALARQADEGSPPALLDFAEAIIMIKATDDHLSADHDRAKVFCDLDLAGLACPWDEFEDNSRRIRMEYASVSDEQFNAGRRAFWQHMLASPRIFRSGFVPDWWEERARENIERDIIHIGR